MPTYSPSSPWQDRPRPGEPETRPADPTRAWPDDAPPRRNDAPKRPDKSASGAAKHAGNTQMRGALMVAGVLGVVVVLAVGLVAVAVLHGSSNRSAAANVSRAVATPSGKASATASSAAKATAKAKAKGKAKAKANVKAKASPKAKASAKKTAASAAKPGLLAVPAGWHLTFDPSFSGTAVNTSSWATCYDWATNPSAGCTNNPSHEREWYIPSQVNVGGGTLNLVAQQKTTKGLSPSGAPTTYTCRSGMVTSKPGFNFTYGLVQVTAKLPYGPGLWPALWLAATNDQWPPELDIMEHWYSQPQMKVYDHTIGTKYLGGPVPTPADLSAGFHTYSLLWTKDRVTWYLDGVKVFTTTSYVPQQQMYFIANVADDSTKPGACTGTMAISSVKVYQP